MEIKVLKNENDYKEALSYIESLIDSGVENNSSEEAKLEVLVTLVQDYESKMFPENIPDPIDALEFVMEQRNLSQEDLVPYIGSRSKISEILLRKRPLSLNMIRALHNGLGIPAKVLLNQDRSTQSEEISHDKFPIQEMIKRGYIKAQNLENEITSFFHLLNTSSNTLALLNRNFYVRSPRPMNQNSLVAWMAQVVNRAEKEKLGVLYKEGSLTLDFLKNVVDLSDEDDAIYKAIDLLKTVGISLIVEQHMPKTYLDGAAIMIEGKNPIIGMTARRDSLDNFWFTLLHELAHISLHYGKGTNLFYDDIESVNDNDPREKEADELALSVLVPQNEWKNSPASIVPSPDAAKSLAKKLSIHPAIVAGKMRYEKKHFHFLNSLIGKGEVQKLFPEIKWQK